MASLNTEKQITETNHSLQQCFKKIIEGFPIEIDLDNIHDILKENFLININNLKPKLQTVLPCMLIHFINTWSGWQKGKQYFNKTITFEEWFTKFKEFLKFKLNYLIKHFDSILKNQLDISEEEYIFKIDGNTQTSGLDKGYAPFKLEIKGPPKLLNSLVFQEDQEGLYT